MNPIRAFFTLGRAWAYSNPVSFKQSIPRIAVSTLWPRALHWVSSGKEQTLKMKEVTSFDKMQLMLRADLFRLMSYRNSTVDEAKKAMEASNSGSVYSKSRIGYLLLKASKEYLELDCLIVKHVVSLLEKQEAQRGIFYPRITLSFDLEELRELRKQFDIAIFQLEQIKGEISSELYSLLSSVEKMGTQEALQYNVKALETRKNILWQTALLQSANDQIAYNEQLLQTVVSEQRRKELNQELEKYRFEKIAAQAQLDIDFVELHEALHRIDQKAYSLKDLREIRAKLTFPLQW